jgi:hypothetical protein
LFSMLVELLGYHGVMRIKNLLILVSGMILGGWLFSLISYYIVKSSRIDPKLESADLVVLEHEDKRRFIWNPRRFRDFSLNVFIASLYIIGLLRGPRISTKTRVLSWLLILVTVLVACLGFAFSLEIHLTDLMYELYDDHLKRQ